MTSRISRYRNECREMENISAIRGPQYPRNYRTAVNNRDAACPRNPIRHRRNGRLPQGGQTILSGRISRRFTRADDPTMQMKADVDGRATALIAFSPVIRENLTGLPMTGPRRINARAEFIRANLTRGDCVCVWTQRFSPFFIKRDKTESPSRRGRHQRSLLISRASFPNSMTVVAAQLKSIST